MKKILQIPYILILTVLLLFTALPVMAAGQNGGEQKSGGSITKIDLGVRELTLEVGESYTFRVTFEPENTAYPYLRWYSSDESVIRIDGLSFTVTALAPGNAVIYAESLDSVSHAVCSVQVSGPVGKDAADLISGAELVPLSETERAKITSGPLKSFLDFVLSTDFTAEAYQKAAQREFMLAVDVVPGTEKAESERALSLGMAASYPLENLNMVTLQGTFEQIMTFAAGDPDLLEIFGGEYYFPDTPGTEAASAAEPSATQKLKGHTEAITHVSIPHSLGYTGEGVTIAVLDTGLYREHEQFAGRVIREKCFTSTTTETQDDKALTIQAVCTGGATESESALVDLSVVDTTEPQALEAAFNTYFHGSHTAGIAAGRDGIAPKANIVAVQLFSWGKYPCKTAEKCYIPVETTQDKWRAYDYIFDLYNAGVRIDVVNMSYGDSTETGGNGFSSVCDMVRPKDAALFKRMTEVGIILVGSAGNDAWNDRVIHPACVSDVYGVGACTKYDDDPNTPVYISAYSDHSRELVDILAPGNEILSASLFDWDIFESEGRLVPGTNFYVYADGTSMAAPMVSGAFALLKQAVPGRTVNEYKRFLPEISRVEANIRKDPECEDPGKCTPVYQFPYPKKVLNFDGFEEFLENVPAPAAQGSRSPLFSRLASADVLPKTGFSALKPQKLSAKPLSVQYEPTHLTIQLPTLDAAADIVMVPFIDGEYPVEWLGRSVGMPEGSALPGEGVSVIVGHNTLNAEEFGPFAAIGLLEEGDRFFVLDAEGKLMTFEVYASGKIGARDAAALEKAALAYENTLTLLTCEDELPEGGYASRRIVSGKRVEEIRNKR